MKTFGLLIAIALLIPTKGYSSVNGVLCDLQGEFTKHQKKSSTYADKDLCYDSYFGNQVWVTLGDTGAYGFCRSSYQDKFRVEFSLKETPAGFLLEGFYKTKNETRRFVETEFSAGQYKTDIFISTELEVERSSAGKYITLDSIQGSCRIIPAALLHKYVRQNQPDLLRMTLKTYPADSAKEPGVESTFDGQILGAISMALESDHPGILAVIYETYGPAIFLSNFFGNPITLAVAYDSYESIKYLIQKFPSSLNAVGDSYLSNPLIYSIRYGSLKAFTALMEAGADVNSDAQVSKISPLCEAFSTGYSEDAQQKRKTIVRELIQHGANQNISCRTFTSAIAAYFAYADKDVDIDFVKFLVSHGANVNADESTLLYALGFGAWSQKTWVPQTKEVLIYLLEKGIDPNRGLPLLALAPFTDPIAVELAEVILQHGGNLKLTRMEYGKMTDACDRASPSMQILFQKYGGCFY